MPLVLALVLSLSVVSYGQFHTTHSVTSHSDTTHSGDHHHYYTTTTSAPSPPTPAPTYCECLSYTADNASYILPDGDGCTYCTGTCSNFQCTCLSKSTCDAIENAAKSFLTWIIGAIVTCILCAIIGCIYRCCIRPRIKAKVSDYQKQINEEVHHAVHLDHVHPVHHVQPAVVDQHGHPVQVVHVQQPPACHQPAHPPVVTMHVTTDHHHGHHHDHHDHHDHH